MPDTKISPKTESFLHWLPIVLAILFILFVAMFSLDIFDGNYGFWGTVVGLLMHNIPSFLLIAILILSWRRRWLGAIVFPLLGLLYVIVTLANGRGLMAFNPLPFIAIIIGICFWVSHKREGRYLESKI